MDQSSRKIYFVICFVVLCFCVNYVIFYKSGILEKIPVLSVDALFSHISEAADGKLERKGSCTMLDWTFSCKVPCPTIVMKEENISRRMQMEPSCTNGLPKIERSVYTNLSIPKFEFKNKCLLQVITRHCSDEYNVPSIVHYIWFGSRKMNFYNFLSIMSASKFLKPCLILIHSDVLPYGNLWNDLVQRLDNLIHVERTPPSHIHGIKISFIEHKADWGRLQAMEEYGGIYIDTDTIILRSLDPLRVHNFTLSKAFDFNLSNGLIMSRRNATFLNIWMEAYKDYDPQKWGYHSTILPYKLYHAHIDLIHVENKTFVNPDYTHANLIYQHNFNWSSNYAIHLFNRLNKTEHDFNDIRCLNTTIGSVSRHVLLTSKELCQGC